MAKLAIKGGTPVRSQLFPSQNTIGPLEKEAANRVLDSGKLTGYQGNWSSAFRGGNEVRNLEAEWEDKFCVKHAIACNSATSGLFIACGAVGLRPEQAHRAIVSPFSMTCSATVPMGWGAHPMFVDIERDFYCIDPRSVRDYASNPNSPGVQAIIPVSLFGLPYDDDEIRAVVGNEKCYIIEDAAQAVGAKLHGKYAGTLGDIGVFSFNLGKHLTCGEGGMIVTNDDELAMKCRLIMNHAEAALNSLADQVPPEGDPSDALGLGWESVRGLFGFNLRLPEISAAIVRVQLTRMDDMIRQRIENVDYLIERLKDIPCLEMPKIREGATHSFYVLPLKYHDDPDRYTLHLSRDRFVEAVKAELRPVKDREHEGVTIGSGYIRPIQNMPLFSMPLSDTPECARQWKEELIIVHRMFGVNASRRDLDDIVAAFTKVWENREELLV